MDRFELKPEDRAPDGADAVLALSETVRELGRTLARARTLTRLADESRPERAPLLRAQSDEHVGDAEQLVDQLRGLCEVVGRAVRTAEGLATLRVVATAEGKEIARWSRP